MTGFRITTASPSVTLLLSVVVALALLVLAPCVPVSAFSSPASTHPSRNRMRSPIMIISRTTTTTTIIPTGYSSVVLSPLPMARISKERRAELGIADDEDEYDLDKALDTNTDPLITKIVAGSLIVVILALLVAGVVIPVTTDYGEGVCNPLLTSGRC